MVADDEFVVAHPAKYAGRRLVYEWNGDERTVRYEQEPGELVTLEPAD